MYIFLFSLLFITYNIYINTLFLYKKKKFVFITIKLPKYIISIPILYRVTYSEKSKLFMQNDRMIYAQQTECHIIYYYYIL